MFTRVNESYEYSAARASVVVVVLTVTHRYNAVRGVCQVLATGCTVRVCFFHTAHLLETR